MGGGIVATEKYGVTSTGRGCDGDSAGVGGACAVGRGHALAGPERNRLAEKASVIIDAV